MEFLFNYAQSHNVMWFSQDYLAKKLGVTRRTINKIIGYLHKKRFIDKSYWYMQTCEYRLSHFFYKKENLSFISHYFKIFSVGLLLSAVHPTALFSLFISFNRNYKNYIIVYAPKRERYMQIDDHVFYTSDVKKITFTKVGLIKLTPFPNEAIDFAVNSLSYSKNVKDPFKLILKLCNEYCKNNEIQPNWKHKFDLERENGITDSMPCVQDWIGNKSKQSTVYKQSRTQKENTETGKRECLKQWSAPTLVAVNKEEEAIKREAAIKSDSAQELMRRWGVTIKPPECDYVSVEAEERAKLFRQKRYDQNKDGL